MCQKTEIEAERRTRVECARKTSFHIRVDEGLSFVRARSPIGAVQAANTTAQIESKADECCMIHCNKYSIDSFFVR